MPMKTMQTRIILSNLTQIKNRLSCARRENAKLFGTTCAGYEAIFRKVRRGRPVVRKRRLKRGILRRDVRNIPTLKWRSVSEYIVD